MMSDYFTEPDDSEDRIWYVCPDCGARTQYPDTLYDDRSKPYPVCPECESEVIAL